jgi:hypothetical protein
VVALTPLPWLFGSLLSAFAPLFSDRVWQQAQVLLIGAMLAPGKRTVTSCLRITGPSQERRFVNYHRIFSRACWSGREASRIMLRLLICQFVPAGPIVLGIDDTIEWSRQMILQTRRWLPNRELVVVADSAFSALEWLHALVRQNITVITRLRLDAALYQSAPSVTRAPTTVLAKSANVYRRCGRFSYTSRHDGNASPCRIGMAKVVV